MICSDVIFDIERVVQSVLVCRRCVSSSKQAIFLIYLVNKISNALAMFNNFSTAESASRSSLVAVTAALKFTARLLVDIC
jgi:hypothetical protein